MLSFEDFLTERNDAIDDLFFRLLKTVNTEDDQEKRICAAKEALKNLKASEEGFPIDNVLAKKAIRLAEDVLKEHKVLSGKPLEWDMSIIGDITETAEKILNDAGIQTCFPFFADDEVPCVNANECHAKAAGKCPFCTRDSKDCAGGECAMQQNPDKGKFDSYDLEYGGVRCLAVNWEQRLFIFEVDGERIPFRQLQYVEASADTDHIRLVIGQFLKLREQEKLRNANACQRLLQKYQKVFGEIIFPDESGEGQSDARRKVYANPAGWMCSYDGLRWRTAPMDIGKIAYENAMFRRIPEGIIVGVNEDVKKAPKDFLFSTNNGLSWTPLQEEGRPSSSVWVFHGRHDWVWFRRKN